MFHSEKEATFKHCYFNVYKTKKYIVKQDIMIMRHDYEEVYCSLDQYIKRDAKQDAFYDDLFFERNIYAPSLLIFSNKYLFNLRVNCLM